MKTGTKVTWLNPVNGIEANEMFFVIEDRDTNILVCAVSQMGWRITPTFVYSKAEMKIVTNN